MDKTDLLKAVERGDRATVEAALEAGVAPDSADSFGVTALLRAVGKGDAETMALLLEHGARVDKSSDQGNTPLMLACARGHVDLVERLLAAGASPEHRNKWDFGPRDWGRWPVNAPEVLARLGVGDESGGARRL